jgi:hypothetical protein
LRLVIEIQSRLKEWTDQEVADNNKQKAESGGQKTESSTPKPEAGTNQKR